MTTSIAIVNYGMGNLHSVAQAFTSAVPTARVELVTHASALQAADRIVLPGQGAMPDCIEALHKSGLYEALLEAARTKPLLGICVGQQILFEHSAEGNTPGLGLLAGRSVRFDLEGQLQQDGSRFKVPHMGWNRVRQTMGNPTQSASSLAAPSSDSRTDADKINHASRELMPRHPLWEGIAQNSFYYFVHSFYVCPDDPLCVAGETDYGVTFACAVARDNLFATQFHPEKSGNAGLQLCRNFAHWSP